MTDPAALRQLADEWVVTAASYERMASTTNHQLSAMAATTANVFRRCAAELRIAIAEAADPEADPTRG